MSTASLLVCSDRRSIEHSSRCLVARFLKVGDVRHSKTGSHAGFISIRTAAVVRVENDHVIGWVACASLVRLMAQSFAALRT